MANGDLPAGSGDAGDDPRGGGRGTVFVTGNLEREGAPQGLPSPGLGLRHYAPRARLVVVHQSRGHLLAEGASCGVMLPDGWKAVGAAFVYEWGPWTEPEVLARRLFDGLRTLDRVGAEVIMCPMPDRRVASGMRCATG